MKPHFVLTIIVLLVFISCQKNSNSPTSSKTSTNSNSGYVFESISGKWVLYQYRDNTNTTPLLRTDTLVFLSDKNYTWNGVSQSYSLYKSPNIYNQYALELNGTPFGNLRGFPPLTFKTYGEIINEPFSQSGVSNSQTFYMWFKKVN